MCVCVCVVVHELSVFTKTARAMELVYVTTLECTVCRR